MKKRGLTSSQEEKKVPAKTNYFDIITRTISEGLEDKVDEIEDDLLSCIVLLNLLKKEEYFFNSYLSTKQINDYYKNLLLDNGEFADTDLKASHFGQKGVELRIENDLAKGSCEVGELGPTYKIEIKKDDLLFRKKISETVSQVVSKKYIKGKRNEFDFNKVLSQINISKKDKIDHIKKKFAAPDRDTYSFIQRVSKENQERGKRIADQSFKKQKKLEEEELKWISEKERQIRESIKKKMDRNMQKYQEKEKNKKNGSYWYGMKMSKGRNQNEIGLSFDNLSQSRPTSDLSRQLSPSNYSNKIDVQLPAINFPTSFKKSSCYKQIRCEFKNKNGNPRKAFSEARDRRKKMQGYAQPFSLREKLYEEGFLRSDQTSDKTTLEITNGYSQKMGYETNSVKSTEHQNSTMNPTVYKHYYSDNHQVDGKLSNNTSNPIRGNLIDLNRSISPKSPPKVYMKPQKSKISPKAEKEHKPLSPTQEFLEKYKNNEKLSSAPKVFSGGKNRKNGS